MRRRRLRLTYIILPEFLSYKIVYNVNYALRIRFVNSTKIVGVNIIFTIKIHTNNVTFDEIFQARVTAPNRRHLFLGQALLLGLFLLAGLSAAASLSQNPLSCAAFRLVGLPAALVFAALLVKCVFLLSLNSGVYLPAPYQVSLITFQYPNALHCKIHCNVGTT